MSIDGLDIVLGFFEGLALILSPCIWPILPIVLASSVVGRTARPYGVIAGFLVTFTLFAFFARQFVLLWGLDLYFLRVISYSLLVLFGITLLSSTLTAYTTKSLQWVISQCSLRPIARTSDGFVSGVFYGGLIALVWTPCAGPILATIIVQTVLQESTLLSFIILASFTAGAALPMLLIALYGKHWLTQASVFKTHGFLLRPLLGLSILASVGYMIVQEYTTPTSSPIQTEIKTATRLQQGLWIPYNAPEIGGIDAWINSPPLQLNQLKNHVILVDFWTYSCINCIRTVPYLNHFYQKYKDKGLIIIGVHSPEFDFEKNKMRVSQAVKNLRIDYPVALDNQFTTWKRFHNQYWPAHYLINQQGQVVYTHFGEGAYDVLENNIRFLLGIDGVSPPIPEAPAQSLHITPETYLGYKRAEPPHAPSNLLHDKPTKYAIREKLPLHAWSLQGSWHVSADHITATQAGSSLTLHFRARTVYMVMGSASTTPVYLTIQTLDANHRPLANAIPQRIRVDQHTLYTVVSLPKITEGVITLTTDNPNWMAYTFTFGS